MYCIINYKSIVSHNYKSNTFVMTVNQSFSSVIHRLAIIIKLMCRAFSYHNYFFLCSQGRINSAAKLWASECSQYPVLAFIG